MANDYNRDVFAVPGRVTDKYSQGCNNLIKPKKANVLTSAADLDTSELGYSG
jgi:DNA processing protein